VYFEDLEDKDKFRRLRSFSDGCTTSHIAFCLQKRTFVALFFPYEKGKIEFIATRICVHVWTLCVCVKESDNDRKKKERSGEREKTGQ